MKDRKRHTPTIDPGTERSPDDPVEPARLPGRNPTRGRSIEDPNPHRKNKVDSEIDGTDEDDDATGEMESAGQDLGLAVDERAGESVEDEDADGERNEGQYD